MGNLRSKKKVEDVELKEMSEKKTTLSVPMAYVPLLEDIRLLKSDEQNPNKMTIKQLEEVWRSLKKHGWAFPIVTDMEGVFADGEQRAQVCREHGEFFAPVLRLSISDVDRRVLRQRLNKLKGKHNKDMDIAEFKRIVEIGESEREDLKLLLASVGERLPDDFDGKRDSVTIPETWELIIECKDESEQQRFFDKLKGEGYRLRILTL